MHTSTLPFTHSLIPSSTIQYWTTILLIHSTSPTHREGTTRCRTSNTQPTLFGICTLTLWVIHTRTSRWHETYSPFQFALRFYVISYYKIASDNTEHDNTSPSTSLLLLSSSTYLSLSFSSSSRVCLLQHRILYFMSTYENEHLVIPTHKFNSPYHFSRLPAPSSALLSFNLLCWISVVFLSIFPFRFYHSHFYFIFQTKKQIILREEMKWARGNRNSQRRKEVK